MSFYLEIRKMYNKLLYGKDQTERVVSLEVKDDSIELFIRNEDGSLSIKNIKNKYWILSSYKYPQFIQLKGELHFKYGRQFETSKEYYEIKKKLRDKDHYLVYDFKEQAMINKGITYYKGMKPEELAILSFDIETTGINLDDNSRVLLISNTFRVKIK